MIRKNRFRLAVVSSVVICAIINVFGLVAIAEPIAHTNVPLFYSATPKGRQIALNEAFVLETIARNVRSADEITSEMFTEINNSTTGFFGTALTHIPGSRASQLEIYARTFKWEAATAYTEIMLLEGGLETHVSDDEYKRISKAAHSMFTLKNGVSPDQYRRDLQLMLHTLHEAEKIAGAGFKAKWGVSYKEALQH